MLMLGAVAWLAGVSLACSVELLLLSIFITAGLVNRLPLSYLS
jgi:hypothetical protein